MQLEIRPRVEERPPGGNVSLGVFSAWMEPEVRRSDESTVRQ